MSLTISPTIKKLLHKRGMNDSQIADFFSWDLNTLPSLTNLKDIQKASLRIIEAIDQQESIAIYGDYDVDGTTSCALLHFFFKFLNVKVTLIQPSRFVEGYGLHNSAIDRAVEENIKVLITVDCGISNNEAALYAKEKGVDLIITDHHRDGRESMPEAFAIINPNRRDETDSELKSLAGVGVAFALCWQIKNDLQNRNRSIPSLYPLLQFVAIGTICDLAYLDNINLRLVRHGLKQMKQTQYPGIKAFFKPEELELNFIPSEKLSFEIGPIINSKGRLDHPEMALELLISEDLEKARFNLEHLRATNNERKFIQAEVYKEAKELILHEFQTEDEHLISMAYRPHWHEGVIGIVASKLVESFHVPALVFTNSEHEGIIKASGRTAGDLNLYELLKEQEHLFLKFGGHKAACGLSMKKEHFPILANALNEKLKTMPAILRTENPDYYDLEIEAEEITPQLLKQLELLEPFGNGNEKPIFKINHAKIASFDILKEHHVRWNFTKNKKNLKGISFNYFSSPLKMRPDEAYRLQNSSDGLSVYFSLGINRFNGNEFIQLSVEKVQN